MDHFELNEKAATVVGADNPAGSAIAEALGEAGADITFVEHVDDIRGPLDCLICDLDHFVAKPIEAIGDDELAEILNRNFIDVFRAVRMAKTNMREGGRIVIVTSVLGARGLPNCSAYSAAHGATQNFIRAAAQELAPLAISINGIELGWMDWMDDRIDPTDENAERAVRFTILKRRGRAEEVGALAVWLSGTGAGFVTGQMFAVDGGLTQHL